MANFLSGYFLKEKYARRNTAAQGSMPNGCRNKLMMASVLNKNIEVGNLA
jgi:hypothetical protein